MPNKTVIKTTILPASKKEVFRRLKELKTLQHIAAPYATFTPEKNSDELVWEENAVFSFHFNEYIQHTLGFRNDTAEYEEKQVIIIKKLFAYVPIDKKSQILNDALVQAVWFGEYNSVKYLLDQGADLSYQSNGSSMIEIS